MQTKTLPDGRRRPYAGSMKGKEAITRSGRSPLQLEGGFVRAVAAEQDRRAGNDTDERTPKRVRNKQRPSIPAKAAVDTTSLTENADFILDFCRFSEGILDEKYLRRKYRRGHINRTRQNYSGGATVVDARRYGILLAHCADHQCLADGSYISICLMTMAPILTTNIALRSRRSCPTPRSGTNDDRSPKRGDFHLQRRPVRARRRGTACHLRSQFLVRMSSIVHHANSSDGVG